ncbi:hypothetical protein SAMN02745181_2100 [Rubritalea squalenifaciens DSM 18772]|uniref:Uncharacterized protein n=1 Tax=Rubritalea squalenifaciens DSM 18772 TaxID=1123071 RepID=A0A1M6JEP9_9BACT|nr:hypothetical protein [Rubritalea squalenifaciens]SHJ45161.1 hypothetical protein SAMN02745181_2100 [Rubritalea squalenifaciens DSM 18772]
MSCHCTDLPETLYLQQAPHGWHHRLLQKTCGQHASLFQCADCEQYWAIDFPRREEPQVVTRISDPDQWQPAGDASRKQLLTHSRGGTTETPCIWAGCGAPTVHQTIYCIDHLYETGARI